MRQLKSALAATEKSPGRTERRARESGRRLPFCLACRSPTGLFRLACCRPHIGPDRPIALVSSRPVSRSPQLSMQIDGRLAIRSTADLLADILSSDWLRHHFGGPQGGRALERGLNSLARHIQILSA